MKAIQPDRLHIISCSGGKDSVAAWLHLERELGIRNIQCVFADTGHESPLTYEYLDYLLAQGCPLTRVQARCRDLRANWPEPFEAKYREWLESPLTMEALAAYKKRFPSPTRRFCTTLLKLMPLRRHVATCLDREPLMVAGVRAQESARRALMDPWAFDDFMGCPRWLPLHGWTADEVFACHRRHGVRPNPLYLHGMARVGCWPCMMARKGELRIAAQRFPEMFDRLEAMEKRAASKAGKQVMTFFSRKKTPPAYRSALDPVSWKRVPTAHDVRNWARDLTPSGGRQLDFTEEGEDVLAEACLSIYGLCE